MPHSNQFFENATMLAATLCNVPASAIWFTDQNWQWLKSSRGFDFKESLNKDEFFVATMAQDDLLIVPDASLDSRFSGSPLVTSPQLGIRFYAGISFGTAASGKMGALLVMNTHPMTLTTTQHNGLRAIAKQISLYLSFEEMNRQLTETSERLTLAMEGARGGLWDWQISSNRVFYSEKWKALLGYGGIDIENHLDTWTRLTHPDDQSTLLKAIQGYFNGTLRDFEFEHRLKTRHGEFKWFLAKGACVRDQSGLPVRMTGWIEDLTEKKRQERLSADQKDRLLHAEKMASVGVMAGSIAHEINNPITIISGNAWQIRNIACQSNIDRDALIKISKKIDDTVQRISGIIKGIKMFSRDGESDPFVSISIKALVEETLGFCQERFKHEGIQLSTSSIDSEWLLECRPVPISQVLLNLLNNAIDAVESLSEKWVSLEVAYSDDRFTISVTDSGKGIPPAVRKKLMQPFFTTKNTKGTGLGLSLSKTIIEGHSGKLFLDLKSTNTRFSIILPRSQKSPAYPIDALKGEEGATAAEQKTILLVDDEESLTSLLASELEIRGLKAICAENGYKALQLLQHHKVDLILSDVRMPEVNGIDFFEKVCERNYKMPFLFMTGYPDLTFDEAIKKGARAMFAKPFKLSELVDAVEKNVKQPSAN